MKNKTHLVVILDRSGSMTSIQHDTIGGLNTLIAEQKKLKKVDTRFTLAQFDDQYELVHDDIHIKEVPLLTLIPRGATALHDAIGRTINHVKPRIKNKDKVIVTIFTDGFENASKEFNAASVKKLIEDNSSWQFTFLGSNQDAVLTARDLGIQTAAAMTFGNTPGELRSAVKSLCVNVANYSSGVAASMKYTMEDRANALVQGNIIPPKKYL